MRRSRALLVIPYFGAFGPWLPLYFHSLAKQRTLDLLLLSDVVPPTLPPNARRVEMTLEQLRVLATGKLGVPVRLHRSRNVCDLRPAYGIVFDEFIQGYEYWAFGDEDVLYGNLDGMLAPQLDGTADLVVPAANGKSGHLTIIRNHSRANELAMKDPVFKDVLASSEHWAYDETSWRCFAEISSFHKIVKQAESRGELSIRWGIPRGTGVPQREKRYLYDGSAIHDETGVELLYYHWGKMRFRPAAWPRPEMAQTGFAFDRYGFYHPELGAARLAQRRAAGRLHEFRQGVRARLSAWRALAFG